MENVVNGSKHRMMIRYANMLVKDDNCDVEQG
jgi:hypothetical protein